MNRAILSVISRQIFKGLREPQNDLLHQQPFKFHWSACPHSPLLHDGRCSDCGALVSLNKFIGSASHFLAL